MKKNTIDWKTALICAGAYTSYNIGSGFASGQEVLQFFGSWGSFWPVILPIITAVMMFVGCYSCYNAGSSIQFDKPSDAYEHYCGKYVAKFMEIFSMIMIVGTGIVMFAGCGSAMHQYLGIPVYAGAIFLGVVSVFVVCLGLEKVSDVLGYAGIIIILFIVIVGFATAGKSGLNIFDGEKHVLEYVQQKKVLQAGLFNIYNPVFSGIIYGGNIVCMSFPFVISLGGRIRNKKEAAASAVISAVLMALGIYFVLIAVLMNLDYIVGTGSQILTIAAVKNVIPVLTLPFTLIIICGIFTTITGYLWLIGRRFAPDKTAKQRIIVIITAIIGIFAGSILPFSNIINFLYPIAGFVGVIMFVLMLVNMRLQKKAA